MRRSIYFRQMRWAWILLIFAMAGTACEDARWSAHVGVTRGSEGGLTVVLHTCSAAQRISLFVVMDPDRLPDTGDEAVLWRVMGAVNSPGVIRIPVGVRPDGFAEPTPFVAKLHPSTEYAVEVRWEKPDQGITFVPSEITADFIYSGGDRLSEDEFRARAASYC